MYFPALILKYDLKTYNYSYFDLNKVTTLNGLIQVSRTALITYLKLHAKLN